MKQIFWFLLCVLSVSSNAEESVQHSMPPPQTPFPNGSVMIGNMTIRFFPGGKTIVLLEDGNSFLYRDGYSYTVTTSNKNRSPQFVHDSTGKPVMIKPAAQAPKVVPRPNPAELRPNRPSPVLTPERPGRSTLPASPFLRPNPISR